jgi:hypothetical protein
MLHTCPRNWKQLLHSPPSDRGKHCYSRLISDRPRYTRFRFIRSYVKQSCPRSRPSRSIGLWDVEAVRLSAPRTGRTLLPRNIFLLLVSEPLGLVRPEGLDAEGHTHSPVNAFTVNAKCGGVAVAGIHVLLRHNRKLSLLTGGADRWGCETWRLPHFLESRPAVFNLGCAYPQTCHKSKRNTGSAGTLNQL